MRSAIWLTVAGMLVLVILAACTNGAPPTLPPTASPPAASEAVPRAAEARYTLSRPGAVEVRRGTSLVQSVKVTSSGAAPVADTAWSADGATVAISDGSQVTVVTVATGATATAPCSCDQVAIAGTLLYALTGLDSAAAGLSRWNLTGLPAIGQAETIDADFGGGSPYRIDGAGEDAVVFTRGSIGAPTRGTGVFVLRQDQTTVQVAAVGELGGGTASADVVSSAYARSGPQNAPVFAYAPGPIACDTPPGRGLLMNFVLVFDPAAANPQLRIFNPAQFSGLQGDTYRGTWEDLWWDEQGRLNATGATMTCGVQPSLLKPYAQYRWDGTAWTRTADAALARTVGGVTLTVTSTGLPGARKDKIDLVGVGTIAQGARMLLDFPPPGPVPTTVERLAEAAAELAPVVRLAAGEKNLPSDASTFITASGLWFDHKTCPSDLVVAHPSEVGLAIGEYSHHPTRTGCGHDVGKVHTTNEPVAGVGGFYLDPPDNEQWRGGQGPTAPVYWQYVDDRVDGGGNGGAFVYWFFYAYNDFTADHHEGDWERVAVRVVGLRPTGMAFFGHGNPSCYLPWDQLAFDGAHPVAYSAHGSHASYPVVGRFPVKMIATDTTSGDGRAWPAAGRLRPLDQELWWGYQGAWGQPGATVSGPAGPNPGRTDQLRSGALTTDLCQTKDGVIPQRLIGAWSTSALLPPVQPSATRTHALEIVLRQGGVGRIVGSVTYPGTACTGVLVLRGLAGPSIVVDQVLSSDRSEACPDRVIRVVIGPATHGLFYEWTKGVARLDPG